MDSRELQEWQVYLNFDKWKDRIDRKASLELTKEQQSQAIIDELFSKAIINK